MRTLITALLLALPALVQAPAAAQPWAAEVTAPTRIPAPAPRAAAKPQPAAPSTPARKRGTAPPEVPGPGRWRGLRPLGLIYEGEPTASWLTPAPARSAPARSPAARSAPAASAVNPPRPALPAPSESDELGPWRGAPIEPAPRPPPAPPALPAPSSAPPFLPWPSPPPGLWVGYPALAPNLTPEEIDQMVAPAAPVGAGGYLRAEIGPTFCHAIFAGPEDAASLDAVGVGVALFAGGWIAPNLVFAAELSAATSLAARNGGLTTDATDDPLGITVLAGGPSFSYVFAGHETSLSFGLLLSKLRVVDRTTSYLLSGTNFAPALELGLSREWTVAPAWALGVGARLAGSMPRDEARQIGYMVVSASLALSLGYE